MLENTERDFLVYQALTHSLKHFWQHNKLEHWQKLETKLAKICDLPSSNNENLLDKVKNLTNKFSSLSSLESPPKLTAITTSIKEEGKEKPQQAFYPIKSLELSKEIFPIAKQEWSDNYKELYKELWQGFLDDVEQLPDKNLKVFLSSLLYLLHKYTWCVPAINKNSKYLPFSLYDQSRISAALAACFYDFGQVKETEDILLIEGDISGIQKFIYNPAFNGQELQDGIAKRLRGRSFYINLLLKTITDYLVEELNLYNVNALWATGGHFLIIAPNTQNVKEKLTLSKEKIQKWLWSEFRGALGLIIAQLPINSDELKDFGKVKAQLGQETTKLKLQQFTIPLDIANKELKPDIWQDSWVLNMQDEICCDTGQDMSKQEKDISDKYQELAHRNDKNTEDINDFSPRSPQSLFFDLVGRALVRTETLQLRRSNEWSSIDAIRKPRKEEDITDQIFFPKPLLIEFPELNRCWLLTEKNFAAYGADLCLHIADHCNSKIDFLLNERKKDKSIVQGFEFLADAVALDNDSKLMDFHQLADKADGAKFLGVLRMDVDNLGFLFSKGFPEGEKSIAHIANLSRMLELFFTGYLNTLVDKDEKGNKHNLYTTYAGGDDLFIVGAWNEVVDLATNINNAFQAYCSNPLLHISGGIALCKGKYPIGRAAIDSGKLLDNKAKKASGKNALAFMEQAISWQDWPKVIDTSKKLIEGLDTGTVSRSFLYNLLALYHQYIEPDVKSTKHPQADLLLAPKFLYSLVRNISDKKLICELQTMIKDQQPYLSVIAGYAALKTRQIDKLVNRKGVSE